MFEVTVNTRRAVVGSKEPITTSSAGILVQFTFSEDWDGLSRFAIFRNGEDMNKIPVALPNSNLVTIPAQSCAEEYIDEPLFVGVYGSDGVGTVIIPTVWASLGVLREGAVTTEIITPAEPTPDMWAQILAIANEAAAIADECEENEELRVAAEQMRADAETARVNAETLRAQAEVERSGNEAQRQSAETQRQIDEDARAQAETLRVQAEELRQANETSRVSAESTRASNERLRQSHERERESVESLRGIRETERINAEWDRQNAETARASAETSRADAESSRAIAEQNRASAETARASAESARATAESTRASNEQSRVSAEAGRVQAETDRATEFATWESTIASKVPNTRTVNGKALSTDITLDSSDIGYDPTETYQSGTAGAALNVLTRHLSDVEESITQEYITLNSSDFTQGTWSGGSISSTNNRICVKQLIPVKAGDKMKYSVVSGLMIAFGTYESGASASTDYHTWAEATTEQEYTFPVDGNAFVQIKKSSEANISPSEYDGTVKIYNTIYNDVVNVKTGLETVNDKIYYTEQKSVTYIDGLINTGGNFASRSSCKVTNVIPLESGQTIKVITKGDGSYIMTVIAKMATADAPISVGQSGGTALKTQTTTSLAAYTYTASDELEYIVCTVKVDDTSVITFENTEKLVTDKLQKEIDGIVSTRTPLITNKYIMLFGDSLTAASTSGVVGFGKIIANDADLPYKPFVYDSADGSTSDVPQTSPCVLNYAKDGTTNRIISSRTDSVLERVKRHIVESTNINYVLIECCVNDAAQSLANKGTISASYTETYDTGTSLGALEETIRYITTLGKPIKVGFFIPWQVSWVSDSWFDDYIAVFEKWAVPFLDLRKTAGFDVKHCTAQSNIYTLTADSYPAYSSTATYNLDDKVKYGGMLYKCIQNNVSGILPTNDEYWMEVSSSASDGTHLNTLGHAVVVGKIQDFLQRL